ncbi:MAG: hypothetical protein R8G66_02275 [Cytophagales bacterium]|nr:hypothetical protein [Cytophagales bacterium]
MAQDKLEPKTNHKYHLMAAGNTEPPVFELIKEMGFAISKQGDSWRAEDESLHVGGESPLELLALITLYQAKGEHWRISDDKIEAFMTFDQS